MVEWRKRGWFGEAMAANLEEELDGCHVYQITDRGREVGFFGVFGVLSLTV